MKDFIDQLVRENPDIAEESKTNPKAMGRFIGLARKINPKANPKALNEELHAYFGHEFKQKVKKKESTKYSCFVWINNQTKEEVSKNFGVDDRNWQLIKDLEKESKELGIRLEPSSGVLRYYTNSKGEQLTMTDDEFHRTHTKHIKTTVDDGEEKEVHLKAVDRNETDAVHLV